MQLPAAAKAVPLASHADAGNTAAATGPVVFRVRLRKHGARGDDDSKRVELPPQSAIASSLLARRQQEVTERKELKKLVLAAERSQVAEERHAEAAAAAAAVAAGVGGKAKVQKGRKNRDTSGFRLGEKDFHSEVRDVRGKL